MNYTKRTDKDGKPEAPSSDIKRSSCPSGLLCGNDEWSSSSKNEVSSYSHSPNKRPKYNDNFDPRGDTPLNQAEYISGHIPKISNYSKKLPLNYQDKVNMNLNKMFSGACNTGVIINSAPTAGELLVHEISTEFEESQAINCSQKKITDEANCLQIFGQAQKVNDHKSTQPFNVSEIETINTNNNELLFLSNKTKEFVDSIQNMLNELISASMVNRDILIETSQNLMNWTENDKDFSAGQALDTVNKLFGSDSTFHKVSEKLVQNIYGWRGGFNIQKERILNIINNNNKRTNTRNILHNSNNIIEQDLQITDSLSGPRFCLNTPKNHTDIVSVLEEPSTSNKCSQGLENHNTFMETDLAHRKKSNSISDRYLTMIDELNKTISNINLPPDVKYVYNPTIYARNTFEMYVHKYCNTKKKIMFLGMNPGPWGMSQTGVPFGEVKSVRDWLKIEGPVNKPPTEIKERPINGFACKRSEVSGKRFWGLIKNICTTPEAFFSTSFVYNYLNQQWMKSNGCNLTPGDIKVSEMKSIYDIYDPLFVNVLKLYEVEIIVAIGKFCETRAQRALKKYMPYSKIKILYLSHPSPRSRNNSDWKEKALEQLIAHNLLSIIDSRKREKKEHQF